MIFGHFACMTEKGDEVAGEIEAKDIILARPSGGHQMGKSSRANSRILQLWDQANEIILPYREPSISKIYVEKNPDGIAGLLGVKRSFFVVTSTGTRKDRDGCLEVQVSQLSGRVRTWTFISSDDTGCILPKPSPIKPEQLPEQLASFLQKMGHG